MISELSDRIWGCLGLAAVRAVPLEEPRAPSAEAAVTELRPRGAAWTRELRLRPLPGQQVFTIDAMRLLVDRLQDLLAIRLPFLAKVSFQILLTRPAVNDEDEDEDRVDALLPQAGAVDREARVSVGPRRNHDGGHQDEVRGRARALPLPRVRLDRRGHHGGVSADRALAAAGRHARAPAARLLEGAARDPCQEEGHLEPSERGPPLLHVVHCLGVEGLTWQERQKTVSCSGSFQWAGSPLWPTRGWTSLACRRTAP